MEISQRDLSEFRKLKKVPSKLMSDSRDFEKEENTIYNDKKDLRKKQLKVGKVILDFFEKCESPIANNRVGGSIIGVGRPKKLDSEKVQSVSIKLPPLYIDYLKNLKFGRGVGTRIRIIIDRFQKYQKRERDQIRIVIQVLGKLNTCLNKYSVKFSRSEKVEINEQLLNELNDLCKEVRILYKILHISDADYREILTSKQMKTLEFALHFQNQMNGVEVNEKSIRSGTEW